MFTLFRVFAAASSRQAGTVGCGVSLFALALLVQSCTTVSSPPLAGLDPADARAPVRSTAYRSTLGTYASERPVEPSGWRDLNEGVAPVPKR